MALSALSGLLRLKVATGFVACHMSLPRTHGMLNRETSPFLRRTTHMVSPTSVVCFGLPRSKKPPVETPLCEEAAGKRPHWKSLSLPTQGSGDGSLPRVNSRPVGSRGSTGPSSSQTVDFASGSAPQGHGRKVTKREEDFRAELLREGSLLLGGGPSFLEGHAVTKSTRKDYERRRSAFEKESGHNLMTVDLALLEMSLLEHFDQSFLDGHDSSFGSKLIAALGYFRPEIKGLSKSGLLPRVRLAMQGWSRVAPGHTRLPLPWPVLASLAVVMHTMDEEEMALATVLSADAYLRPGETLWLSGDDVTPGRPEMGAPFASTSLLLFPEERGRASKTHRFNNSVVLDSRGRAWLGRLIAKLAAQRRGKPLFRLTYLQWLNGLAAAALGLQLWELTLYVLRHTGPSHDFLAALRTLLDIQRRGRWALESSVRRYEKSSRVTSRLKDLSPEMLSFCHACDLSLGQFLEGRRPLPPLPRLPATKRRRLT